MTTFEFTTENCPVCSTPAQVSVLASSSTFGPPDLDTRPALLLRDALPFQIVTCASCGFCWEPGDADDIDVDEARQVVTSEAFRNALKSAAPDPAPAFLARSVFHEMTSHHADAGWSALQAAWVCDDAGDEDAAREARLAALRSWSLAIEHGESIHGQEDGDAILCADLLRRTGQFRQGLELIDARLPTVDDVNIAIVLKFCRELCAARDASIHTVDEAFAVCDDTAAAGAPE